MSSIVKSVRIDSSLEERVKEVLRDSKREGRLGTRRPMRESEALLLSLQLGAVELERRTVGWRWRCDKCGQVIEAVRDGVLEWVDAGGTCRDLQLVHSPFADKNDLGPFRCGFDARAEALKDSGSVMSYPLSDVVGPDGALILRDLAWRSWESSQALAEVQARLLVPGYEQVRVYRPMAARARVYRQHAASLTLLRMRDIEAIAHWMMEENDDDAERRRLGALALQIIGAAVESEHGEDD